MKRLLLTAALLGDPAAVEESTAPTTEWDVACMYTSEALAVADACDGISPPIVVVSYIVDDHISNLFANLRGIFYPGEPYIFVNAALSDEQIRWTTIHEMVHFITTGMELDISRCENEQLARDVTREAGGPSDPNWVEVYGCEEKLSDNDSLEERPDRG